MTPLEKFIAESQRAVTSHKKPWQHAVMLRSLLATALQHLRELSRENELLKVHNRELRALAIERDALSRRVAELEQRIADVADGVLRGAKAVKRDLSGAIADVVIAIVLFFITWIGLILFAGCTPHVAPIDVRSTYDEWPKCERCGEPATENVSEVADEFNWRCDRCKPRDVMPRRVPRIKSRKLETRIAKG